MNKQISAFFTLSVLSLASASAADLDIKLTNLTHGIYFTPVLLAAHNSDTHFYREGIAASLNLQAMAEGGDISGLSMDAQSMGGDVLENPAVGLLAPGASFTTNLTSAMDNMYLSLTAMLLPTNDGFVGVDSLMIPTTPGTYTYHLNAYDAGTEANDELISGGGAPGVAGIPADPGGMAGANGSGVAMSDVNTMVHIHRGNLGDTDSNAGISDLNSTVHRWLNPVAELVITVN